MRNGGYNSYPGERNDKNSAPNAMRIFIDALEELMDGPRIPVVLELDPDTEKYQQMWKNQMEKRYPDMPNRKE